MTLNVKQAIIAAMVKLNKKGTVMKNDNTTTKKETVVSSVKVGISLTLLVTALNISGYLALSVYSKYFCATVLAVVGLYSLIRNTK